MNGAIYSSALESMWMSMHIPLAVLGTAFCFVGFVSGIMYFIMERQLKRKKFGKIFERLPSLDTINKIYSASLHLGFGLYTAGIMAIIAWTRFHFSQETGELLVQGSFLLKVTLACTAWVIAGVIILIRSIRTTTARQSAILSIIGIISVLLIYVGVVIFALR
jgi:ABC-type transport system involved in cytochrome c biogenesis permease subunit